MIGGIGNAVKEAQEVLDKGGQLGGRYSGNRNPTEVELKSWRTVLSVGEDRGAMNEVSLKHANAILDRWDKVGGYFEVWPVLVNWKGKQCQMLVDEDAKVKCSVPAPNKAAMALTDGEPVYGPAVVCAYGRFD